MKHVNRVHSFLFLFNQGAKPRPYVESSSVGVEASELGVEISPEDPSGILLKKGILGLSDFRPFRCLGVNRDNQHWRLPRQMKKRRT